MNRILQIKRELIVFRRAIWPERDKINDILRSSFDEVPEETKLFFRDSYDHCIQILDIVESYKEVTASLMDVYPINIYCWPVWHELSTCKSRNRRTSANEYA